MAPQTPQQKRANAKFAKIQESKMGTYRSPKADKETRRKEELSQKFGVKKGALNSRVGRGMVYLLVFVLIGGIFFELIRMFF